MKIILLQDVKSVGKKGDLVNASEGYAKNFLIPKKLGVEANKANMAEYEARKKAEAKREKEEYEEALALGEKLKEVTVIVGVKAGENGKVFGSVTNKEIATALFNQTHIDIDRKKISVTDPIKNVGENKVTVKVHPKVSVDLKINVKAV